MVGKIIEMNRKDNLKNDKCNNNSLGIGKISVSNSFLSSSKPRQSITSSSIINTQKRYELSQREKE